MDIRPAKQGLFAAMKEIGNIDWRATGQPWLNPRPPVARNTTASKAGFRADQNGQGVRSVKASDLGAVLECERRFGATYAGVAMNPNNKVPLNYGKGGTEFHKFIETKLPSWIETEQNTKWEMFVQLPSIGQRTQKEVTGKKRHGITGKMDGYLPQYQIGLELKSVPNGWELPTEVGMKALGQAAVYAYGLNNSWKDTKRPVGWFHVYLPLDMTSFNPRDMDTYKVFFTSWEELEPIAISIFEKATNVAAIIDEHGFENSWDLLACYRGAECTCNN